MCSNNRYCGVESSRSKTTRFDMSEDRDEEDREEVEEAEDDDQRMPEPVWGLRQQRDW